jgi:hypothetical protein
VLFRSCPKLTLVSSLNKTIGTQHNLNKDKNKTEK